MSLTWLPGAGGTRPIAPLPPVNPRAQHHGEDIEDVQPQVPWMGTQCGLQHPQDAPATPRPQQHSPRASPSVILPK